MFGIFGRPKNILLFFGHPKKYNLYFLDNLYISFEFFGHPKKYFGISGHPKI